MFSHGAEGYATPQIRSSTMVDIGGYSHFKNLDHQFLFAYGLSVAACLRTMPIRHLLDLGQG